MAALVLNRFGGGKCGFLRAATVNFDKVRYRNKPKPRYLPPRSTIKWKFEWEEKSLASRGFLRPLKPYQPPPDVPERLKTVCEIHGLPFDDSTKIEDLERKFHFLLDCEKEFNYSVPNSHLHLLETIEDIRNFYETPIKVTLPFDDVKKMELPKNLHIQYDYNRFHPSTDTKFNGKTAFPRSSTIVSGLAYKKKYRGLRQDNPFES